MTPIEQVARFLKGAGWDAQLEGDALMLPFDESELARGELYLETSRNGAFWQVQFDAALSLLVEEEGVGEVLLGLNLLNAGLPLGHLYLEPISEDENPIEDALAFSLWARHTHLLPSLEAGGLTLLEATLEGFLGGLRDSLTASLDMQGAMKA